MDEQETVTTPETEQETVTTPETEQETVTTPETEPETPSYEQLLQTVNTLVENQMKMQEQMGNFMRALGATHKPEDNFFTQNYSRYKGGKK